ncbi:MAG: hypothetical protein JJ899_13115 [Alphaproteobacteria bacterium]|nr:hypothetical protein [Alphaproteobacteria bacterium]
MSDATTEVKYNPDNKEEKRKREARKAMIVGRIIGWIFLIAAIAVLVRDVLTTIDAGAVMFIAAGELWFSLHQDSLQLAEPAIARHVPWIGPWLWHPVISTILTWPAVVVFGVPGLLLSWLFRKRAPKPGMFR